jgi:DNA primase
VSPLIKNSSLEAVLAAANIIDVVSGYTSLRKRGNTYLGLCPFHQEKTPSFTVSAEKGLYYCFGCGEGGDILRFLERIENLSFSEAVEHLSQRYNIPLEFEEESGGKAVRSDHHSRLVQVLEKAAKFYERYLWETKRGQAARDYLQERGLTEDGCRAFRVGLAPGEWQGLYRRAGKEGFTAQELEDAGLLVCRKDRAYDRFRGRLMFPLIDQRGRVLGFGGRALRDESPKYLNSPEGPLYQKGRLLYGLYQARRAIADRDEVVVVEGYTDVIGLVQAGVYNVVASMGTALTDAQVGLIMRFTKNITFMFDADRAGMEAVLRSGRLARNRALRPMVALLPGDSDPADVAIKGGAAAVATVMAGKLSLLGFELRRALSRADVSTVEGRVRAFDEVRGLMARASSPKEREEEMAMVVERLRLSDDNIRLLLQEGVDGRSRAGVLTAGAPGKQHIRVGGRGGSGRGRTGRQALAERLPGKDAGIERDFLAAAVCNPQVAATLLEALTPEHFTEPGNREVFAGVLEAFRSMETGGDSDTPLVYLGDRARSDSTAGRLFVRLLMEIDEDRYGPAVLEELHLRLQEQHLVRGINRLRAELRDSGYSESEERRLFHLERLLQTVRLSLTNLDPEGGYT